MITILVFIILLAGSVFTILNHPAFGRLPQGERLERIKRSPNYRDGKFHNIHLTPATTMKKGGAQAFWDFFFGKHPDLKPHKSLPTVKTDLLHLDRNEDLIIWFGHSSYLVQSGGKRFLIDPVLTNKFPASLMFQPFKGTDLYKPEDIPDIDFLIITHEHWDHLDYYTVKQLKDRTGAVICGLGVGEYFEYWGFPPKHIVEMDWYDCYHIDNECQIHCLPARHFSNRLLKNAQTLWASFMIDGKQQIYLSGDGGYDTHFAEIGKRFPQIDLAIMENGQYNEDWRYIHLMPNDLPLAIKDLRPKQALTVHHSKYALSKHPWYEPLENIHKASNPQSYKLLTPMIGEKINLNDTNCVSKKWW